MDSCGRQNSVNVYWKMEEMLTIRREKLLVMQTPKSETSSATHACCLSIVGLQGMGPVHFDSERFHSIIPIVAQWFHAASWTFFRRI